METVNQVIDSLTAVAMVVAVVVSFLVVLTAGVQALRMRNVRWDALLFILVILWMIPIGLRYYGPELMDASTDSIMEMADRSPRMREAVKLLLADVIEPWQETPVAGFPIATPQPMATPTNVPLSTIDPLTTPINIEMAVTATPMLPTATPDILAITTENAARITAMPTIDLSIWNLETPPPTPKANQ